MIKTIKKRRQAILDGKGKLSKEVTQWNKKSTFFELPYWESFSNPLTFFTKN
jgi:hypothetical protein